MKELVPEVERKHGVSCAKAGDKMILESANRSFCCVALMHQSRWCKLVVIVLSLHELLEQLGGFMVELLQLPLESSRFEDCDCSLARCKMGFFCSAGHWFNVDEVRSMFAQDEHALIAAGGVHTELASGFGLDLPGCWLAVGKERRGVDEKKN